MKQSDLALINAKEFRENYTVLPNGDVKSIRQNKILKQEDLDGYKRVCIYSSGKRVKILVHRLVAMLFVDNPDNKKQVNHVDGNKSNNHYLNLEWCTNSENITHASLNGLNKKKLTLNIAKEIKANKSGYTQRELAAKYGVSVSTVNEIINNKIWREA